MTSPDIIYGLTDKGDLYWYRHLGQPTGAIEWLGSGMTNRVATGWTDVKFIFATGPYVYVVDNANQVWWRKHLGQAEGRDEWSAPRRLYGPNNYWHTFLAMCCTGEFIYGLRWDNQLYWYRHLGQADGVDSWFNPGSGTAVANMPANLTNLFAVGEYVYAADVDGRLLMWRHAGQGAGGVQGVNYVPGTVVGTGGWRPPATQQLFGSMSYIYRVDENKALRWYRHTGQQAGTADMEAAGGGRVVAPTWSFVRTFSPGGPAMLPNWWAYAEQQRLEAESLRSQRAELDRKLTAQDAQYAELQADYAALEGQVAARTAELEQEYREKLAEAEKARAGTTLSEFIKQSNAEVMQARRQLEATGSEYRLGKVTMALKYLPSPAGTGMSFPQPADVPAGTELSTLELDLVQLEKTKQPAAPSAVAPELTGYSEVVARRKLAAFGVADVTRYFRAVAPLSDDIDRVVDQLPRPGAPLEPGTPMTIIVGKASA